MEIQNNNFSKNNNFVYFKRPKAIKTYLDNNDKETKRLPFDKDFSWKVINENNYKDYVNDDDKSFFIRTGIMSNITVIDFDDAYTYEKLVEGMPELKNHFTVKTRRGYHLYCKYNEILPTATNINGLDGVDIRNDGGIVIAPPTKYKLLDGTKAKYEYLYGDVLEIPPKLLKQFLPKKKEQQEVKKENKAISTKEIKEVSNLINLLDIVRSDNYNEWIKTGIIIYNILNEQGRDIFIEFSQLSNKFNLDECNKKYDSFQNEKEIKLTIGTLKMMAKEDSPEEYSKLYKDFVKEKNNHQTNK